MPFVTINLLSGRTDDQKAAAAEGIARVLAETIGAQPSMTQVVFVDVAPSNWAHGGELVSRRPAKRDDPGKS